MFRILAVTGNYAALVGPFFDDKTQAEALAFQLPVRVFNASLILGLDPNGINVKYVVVNELENADHDYLNIKDFVADQLRRDCSRNYGLRDMALAAA